MVTRLYRIRQSHQLWLSAHLEPDHFDRKVIAAQAGFKIGQQLPQFGARGVVAQQQAPDVVLQWPRQYVWPQRWRDQMFDRFEPRLRGLLQRHQARQ